jgi:hypothetical protein
LYFLTTLYVDVKEQRFASIPDNKKLNLDRYGFAFAQATAEPSGTKLSQFAVPKRM